MEIIRHICYCWLFFTQTDKKRCVDETDGKLWADAHGFLYFEVSALTVDGISDLFQVNSIIIVLYIRDVLR